jgi:hypothetical protein
VHHGNRKILIFRNGKEYKAGSTRPTPFAYPKREYSAWSSRFCRTARVFPHSSSPVSHTPIKLPPAGPTRHTPFLPLLLPTYPRRHPPPHLPPSSATFQLRPTPSLPSPARRPLPPPACLPPLLLLLPPSGTGVSRPRSAGSDPRAGGSSSAMAHGGPAGELASVAGRHLPAGGPPRAASPLLSSPPLPPPRRATPSLAAVEAPWPAQDLKRRGAPWPAPPSTANRSSSHLLPPCSAAAGNDRAGPGAGAGAGSRR